MTYSYDRRPHVAAFLLARSEAGALRGLVQKYMTMLGLDIAPKVNVSDNIGATRSGVCKWIPGHKTSTIHIQKSVLSDPVTLERVLAHEMAHHAVFLGNIRDLETIVQERGSQAGPYVRGYIRDLRRRDGHGEAWLQYVKIINGHMGSGFVTPKSDDTYVESQETKPYYLLIAKLPNGRFGFQIGVTLSSRMKQVIDKASQRYEAKLIKTTDPKWQHGPRIGNSNWAVSMDKQDEMQRLHSGA